MSKIIIEYLPALSAKVQKLINTNVSYSMISDDETSRQYDISQCLDTITEYDDVYTEEIKYLSELISEGVSFLEF